jgi:hypothetical protein
MSPWDGSSPIRFIHIHGSNAAKSKTINFNKQKMLKGRNKANKVDLK